MAPPADQSEDCLYLNIFAPAVKPKTPLPVRVWIYGGGLQSGSVSLPYYTGCVTGPATNSIVVAMNYRVGALGFLAHPSLAASDGSIGNYGFLDQQLALRWVKSHIADFGGDPDRVGIFGESAGGDSVFMHLVSPGSANLFNSAIVQSGQALDIQPIDYAAALAEKLAAHVGCTSTEPEHFASCLRQVLASLSCRSLLSLCSCF